MACHPNICFSPHWPPLEFMSACATGSSPMGFCRRSHQKPIIASKSPRLVCAPLCRLQSAALSVRDIGVMVYVRSVLCAALETRIAYLSKHALLIRRPGETGWVPVNGLPLLNCWRNAWLRVLPFRFHNLAYRPLLARTIAATEARKRDFVFTVITKGKFLTLTSLKKKL